MKRKTTKENRVGQRMREGLAEHLERYGESDIRTKKANAYGHRKPYAEYLHSNDVQKEQNREDTSGD